MREGGKENTALSQIGRGEVSENPFWSSKERAPFSAESVKQFVDNERSKITEVFTEEREQDFAEQKESLASVTKELLKSMNDILEAIDLRKIRKGRLEKTEMQGMHDHWSKVETPALIIVKKIETRGISYIMTENGYNDEALRDIETLLDAMMETCPGVSATGNVEDPDNEIGQICAEKEKNYGDLAHIDWVEADRNWEEDNIKEINKSLEAQDADFKKIFPKIKWFATGMIHSQSNLARQFKSIIGHVNNSSSGRRIETDRKRVIDSIDNRPLYQLEYILASMAEPIRTAVNASLLKTQIIEADRLPREWKEARATINDRFGN